MYQGNCYQRFTTALKQAAADTACNNYHGRLTSLCSSAERSWVSSTFAQGKYYFLIGGFNGGSGWKWIGGDTCSGSSIPSWWDAGQPSGDGACVEMRPNGNLNDIPCGDARHYVCEVKGSNFIP